MFYKSKKIMGMPVVSLGDGHQLGRVKRLLIDQHKMFIMAFTIDRKGWFKEQPVIPYSHVKSVGNHAVTVDQATAVVRLSSMPELEALAKKSLPLVGVRAISEEGTVLGTVTDFYFDPQDGAIHSLEIKGGPLHSPKVLENSLIITCGRDAIIVKSGAEECLHKGTGLFSGKWQEACSSASKALGETGRYTRKLTSTIAHCWGRLPFINKKDGAPPPGDNN
jgi:uncharacterized protein YrrD